MGSRKFSVERRVRRWLGLGVLTAAAGWSAAQACTSLLYFDMHKAPYAGRTLELPLELPYHVAYVPAGTRFGSQADHHHKLEFTAKHAFLSIGVPDFTVRDLKVVEGVNDQGLTFSLLAFASTQGPKEMVAKTQAVLAAIDLGAWTLSQFGSVAEVKAALASQPVMVTELLPFGAMPTPFHYSLHDATGASLVIEYANGKQSIYDNPIGVMTNGPEFPWHITNLNNYTHLTNRDHSTNEIRGQKFSQPDSGIATAALPGSNTSVGRFVRAVYYSSHAEKARNAEHAITTLAHVMNNFDRPRGITVDERWGSSGMNLVAPSVNDEPGYWSEYTSWTTLTDLRNRRLFVRTYDQLNYVGLDMAGLKDVTKTRTLPLQQVAAAGFDGTAALRDGAR